MNLGGTDSLLYPILRLTEKTRHHSNVFPVARPWLLSQRNGGDVILLKWLSLSQECACSLSEGLYDRSGYILIAMAQYL